MHTSRVNSDFARPFIKYLWILYIMEESKRGDDAMQAMELDADELEAVGILANMSNPLHQ